MNALVLIETDLLVPTTVFAPGGVEGIISKLETDVRATPRDITTEPGREAVRALAYKVARSKTALDEMGKELVADIKKQSGVIDAERRIIRERLDALRDEVRGPLTAWEDAEKARVDEHERELVFIVTAPSFQGTPTATQLSQIITHVQETNLRDWQEFAERAEAATAETLDRLTAMYNAAVQAERDAAELAELRRLKAERDAADTAAEQQAKAAESARLIEAARLAREAEEAEQAKAREIERAAQAQRSAEASAAKAVEDERQRVAAAKAAQDAATAKREANKRHRTKINLEITIALSEVLTGDANEAATLIEAIAGGKIPHVSIAY